MPKCRRAGFGVGLREQIPAVPAQRKVLYRNTADGMGETRAMGSSPDTGQALAVIRARSSAHIQRAPGHIYNRSAGTKGKASQSPARAAHKQSRKSKKIKNKITK